MLSPGDIGQLFSSSFFFFFLANCTIDIRAQQKQVTSNTHVGKGSLPPKRSTLTTPATSFTTFFKITKQRQMTKSCRPSWCRSSPKSRLQHRPFLLPPPSATAALFCLKKKQTNQNKTRSHPPSNTFLHNTTTFGILSPQDELGILFLPWPLTRDQGMRSRLCPDAVARGLLNTDSKGFNSCLFKAICQVQKEFQSEKP